MRADKRRAIARSKNKPLSQTEARQSTPEKLKAAGLALFSRQGYAETSTKQICEFAEANSAAVTYHFETKQNLLLAILSEQIQKNTLTIDHILKAPESLDAFKVRLRMFCDTFIDFRISNPEFHRLLLREAFRIPEAFEKFRVGVKSIEANLTNFLKAAKKSHFISADFEISAAVFLLIQMMTGPRLESAARSHPEFDLHDSKKRSLYIDRMLEMFHHGVATSFPKK